MPSLIDLFHMLSFKNMGKTRDRHISLSSGKKIKKNFKINNMADSLHPQRIHVVVKEVIPSGRDCMLFTFEREDGKPFPFFRAGQYVTLELGTKDGLFSRPYSICSSPKEAQNGVLRVMIKKAGRASAYFSNVLDPDTLWHHAFVYGPFGDFTYDSNRDRQDVIALAGGSGITPFLSMAHAIAEGDEDFNLTILYGSRDRDSISLYEEIKRIADTEERVKLVPILSEEKRQGFESGFITAEMIEKHIPKDIEGEKLPVSVFVCGPQAMYDAMEPILQGMGFEKKDVRFECAPGARPDREAGQVDITVRKGNEVFTIPGYKEKTIIEALDLAEVRHSRCRSGSCGYCRGRLLSGQVLTPPQLTDGERLNHNGFDHRRETDKKMGIVHLCVTYPETDIEIEIIG